MEPNTPTIVSSGFKFGRFFSAIFLCILVIGGGLILVILNLQTQRNGFLQDLAFSFYTLNSNTGGMISNVLFILMIISGLLFVYFFYKKKYSYAALFAGISFFAIVIPTWSFLYIYTPGGGQPINSEQFCITDLDPLMAGCQ